MPSRREIELGESLVQTRWILSCEHAGHRVPARYAALFRDAREALGSHRGWDPGALELAKAFQRRFHAPLAATTVSRLLVETNRSPRHPQLFSEFSRVLDVPERQRVVAAYYEPHRRRVATLIDAVIGDGDKALHASLHTFTPQLGGKVRRADVGLLYDPSRRWERALCATWRKNLLRLRPDLRVRRNYPYLGKSDGLTTALRRQFAPQRYAGIELEVNQRWLADRAAWRRLIHDLVESATALR